MSEKNKPVLSVILPAIPHLSYVKRTLEHLAAQTIAHQMEIIVVTTTSEHAQSEYQNIFTLLDGFQQHSIIYAQAIHSAAEVYAQGVQHATADIVAFGEDHSFPQAGWAEALVTAHENDHAVVGPAVRNANPDTLVSWCDMLMGYGPWLEPQETGVREFLPGHNSSYKRDILLALPDLEAKLAAETILHWELREQGYTLLLESKATTAHTNFSLYRTWLPPQYFTGRVFAASRANEWNVVKKLIYAALSPLIPFIRLKRFWGDIQRSPACKRRLPLLAILLLFGLSVSAFGEMVGYLTGEGHAAAALSRYEFHRAEHIHANDRTQLGL